MKKAVGFDQKIKLNHLDYIAFMAKTEERKHLYEKLDEYLYAEIKGDKSRKNAITMLMKIWCLVDNEHKELQKEAFELLPVLNQHERIVLHWGMTILAYPFFRDLVTEMGHLFMLQNEVSSQQIGRKMKGLYGDRRRVEVSTSAVLMSIKTWGLINASKSGIYTETGKLTITHTELKLWLSKVVILSSQYEKMSLEMINSSAMTFPFDFNLNVNEFEKEYFEVNRQGLDMVMIGLK
ncbi:MAG: hypothetical protein H0Z33_16775 [Bacillaceae bacterium]|nr:hypothetical protein [Bacillaceae bacterium]